MKLNEIKQNRGTYMGLYVLDPANEQIKQFINDNNIPHKSNSEEKRKHVTLIYSRKYCPNIEVYPEAVHTAKPVKFEVFPTQDGKRALVVILSAPTVDRRHRELMSLYDLTYDYPQYHSHITLSYDIGDFDISGLPLPSCDILLGLEYIEDLKLEWQNK